MVENILILIGYVICFGRGEFYWLFKRLLGTELRHEGGICHAPCFQQIKHTNEIQNILNTLLVNTILISFFSK